MPNREVDAAPWPLPKHREVKVQRSELVFTLAPHCVRHIWFGCAPGLWFSLTWYPVKYLALTPSSTPHIPFLLHFHPPKSCPQVKLCFIYLVTFASLFMLRLAIFLCKTKKEITGVGGFVKVALPLALCRHNLPSLELRQRQRRCATVCLKQ